MSERYEITKCGILDDRVVGDSVNRPSHYTSGRIEVIDFIEDQKLCYHLGNAVKYIARAGKKDPAKYLEDLQKASWYLSRKIESLAGQREPINCIVSPIPVHEKAGKSS